MWFDDWLWGLLLWLGLIAPADQRLLILGLDNGGKTTLLHRLTERDALTRKIEPTATGEHTSVGPVYLETVDLGGQQPARREWYTRIVERNLEGIVFVIDASDPSRQEEARAELASILQIRGRVPLVVLGNKMDLHGAVREDNLAAALRLGGLRTGKDAHASSHGPDKRPLELFMCSAAKGRGYGDGLHWLAEHISHGD
jgi:GTP-binding protein SAR1